MNKLTVDCYGGCARWIGPVERMRDELYWVAPRKQITLPPKSQVTTSGKVKPWFTGNDE